MALVLSTVTATAREATLGLGTESRTCYTSISRCRQVRTAVLPGFAEPTIEILLTAVGFSFDELFNGTINRAGTVVFADYDIQQVPEQSRTLKVGTFSSGSSNNTISSSEDSAKALWYFLQIWLNEFAEFKGGKNKVLHSKTNIKAADSIDRLTSGRLR